MPVHIGIMCERCWTVLFAATWHDISPSRKDAQAFEFACKPPCPAIREFRKSELRPYRVSEDVFSKGYARQGEYQLIQEKVRPPRKPL